MDAILAVDGGGTKTEFMLTSIKGEVLCVKKYKGTNLNSYGFDDAFETLSSGVIDFKNIAKKNNIKIVGAYFGLAGGVNGKNQQIVYNFFKNKYFQDIPFSNAGDDLNAINVGVKDAENGIAVIAGTGSNCMIKKQGVVLSNPGFSGWGYFFDNGASGFDFGRDAIIASKNDYNGTGKQTIITKMLENKLGVDSVFNSLKAIYEKGPNFIASLAPVVFDAYKMGDEVASEIVDNQIQNVADMVNYSHKIIGENSPAMVGLVGGIFSHESKVILPKLENLIDKNLSVNVPNESQIYGALMEAGKNAGIKLDEKFRKTYNETVNEPSLNSNAVIFE